MTKAELLLAVSEKANLSKTQADSAIKALTEVIQQEVAAGNEISLPDLGKFVRVEKPARTARNPKTGESVLVAPSKAPKFKPAKAFKEIVNK